MVSEEKKSNEVIKKDVEARNPEKGTYLVSMEIKATYTQLITGETRRNAEEIADATCQKADFKRGLLDVIDIKTGTIQKGKMQKIGAQIIFFPVSENK